MKSGGLTIDRPKISGIFRAKVEDNNDPNQLGRIRATIYPHFRGIPADKLPWAVPAFGLWEGAGDNVGCVSIPDVGTYVFVFFENNDPYQPVYFANASTGVDSKLGLPVDLMTPNYPNRKVWRTSSGIEIYIDDTDNEIKVRHPAEVTVKIDKDGNVEVITVGKIDILAEKDVTISTQQDATVVSEGSVYIQGATVNIN